MNKVREAHDILNTLGLPPAQQNEMSALTLLALCGLSKRDEWSLAQRHSVGVTKGIMSFVAEKYGKKYAPNTRETFGEFRGFGEGDSKETISETSIKLGVGVRLPLI